MTFQSTPVSVEKNADDAHHDEGRGAGEGRGHPVDPFGGDQRVGHDEDRYREHGHGDRAVS